MVIQELAAPVPLPYHQGPAYGPKVTGRRGDPMDTVQSLQLVVVCINSALRFSDRIWEVSCMQCSGMLCRIEHGWRREMTRTHLVLSCSRSSKHHVPVPSRHRLDQRLQSEKQICSDRVCPSFSVFWGEGGLDLLFGFVQLQLLLDASTHRPEALGAERRDSKCR